MIATIIVGVMCACILCIAMRLSYLAGWENGKAGIGGRIIRPKRPFEITQLHDPES
jgi:hypothetical protein